MAGGKCLAATPTYTVSLTSTAPNIGKVASAASGVTYFIVNAASGAVSISGSGQFVPYNATRTALTTITINCSGGNKCGQSNATVTINAGAATARASPISALSADFTGSATAQLTSGGTSVSSSTGALSFTIKPIGNSSSKSFHLGLTLPINSTGAVGVATAAYTISVSGSGVTSGSGSASARATVEGGLSVTRNSDLSFGTLVLIKGQSGTATWTAADQTWHLDTSTATPIHAGPTIGQFTVTGTPSQAIQFQVPSTIPMFNSHGDELDVTVSTTAQGTQLIGADGKFVFYVGGQIPYTDATPSGTYSATFTVLAKYQ